MEAVTAPIVKRHWRTMLLTGIAIFYLGFVITCFYGAIFNPYLAGLAPIFVYAADLPASLLCEIIDNAVRHSFTRSYSANLIVDGVAYAFIGTLWWVSIFWLLTWPIRMCGKD